MSLRRYENVKSLMEAEKFITEMVMKHGNVDAAPEIHKEYTKKVRDALKYIDRNYVDHLAKPITEGWRTVVRDPDDIALSGYDFRILISEDPDDWTDEEIEEYIMEEVGYPPICGPYDCTGKRFTRWCNWSRQPVGIVMIHAWGTDL